MSKNAIEKFVDDLDEPQLTDLVMIVSKQDPTESKPGGGARWNSEQRDLILTAQTAVEEEGLGD